jgi:TonB-linked SusC/RagA family outer membrane protein
MISPRSVTARVLGTIGLLLGSAGVASAQGATITGIVTDMEGRPIPGATVLVVNTTVGTQTRDDGRYTLTKVPEGVKVVEARRIGFQPARRENVNVPGSGTLTIDFKMPVQTLRLQTVVTTGVTDPTEGVKLPITVAKLTAADMPVPSTGSPANALQGKVAGVQVIRGRGSDGTGTVVRLRTATSQFKDPNPMYIVDGVILAAGTADIETLDIATIEVIKGASAASLYGSKAANGVISITTNRGGDLPQGTTQFKSRQEYGFNTVAKAYEKVQHHNYRVNAAGEYVDTLGNVVPRLQRALDTIPIIDNAYIDPLYDHEKQFFENGRSLSSNLTLSQNSQATNFAASYNYQREPGVIVHLDGRTTNNFRINLDNRMRDFLRFSFSAFHSRAFNEPSPSNIHTDITSFRPDVNLLAPPLAGSGVPYLIQPDANESRTNPLYRTWRQRDTDRRARTLISAETYYTPLSWLTVDGNFSYDRQDRLDEDYIPKGAVDEDGTTRERGDYSKFDAAIDGINAQLGVTGLRAFGDLTSRTVVRGTLEKQTDSRTTATSNTFATSTVKELDAGLTRSSTSSFTDIRAASVLGSTALDYAGKYIGDLLLRYDGSSLFGPQNRWNIFYRASAAYRMAEEPWWPFADINEFKIRYSVGTGGTRPDFTDQYELYLIEVGGGIVRRELGNPALAPEVAKESEAAIEMIFKNRVSFQFSAIQNHSTDNIIGIAAPAGSGFNTQELNTGEIKAYTYEATVEAQLIQRPKFQWSANLVWDKSSARVTEFNRPCYGDDNGFGIRCEGYKMSWAFGRKFIKSTDDLPPYVKAVPGYENMFQVNDEGFLVYVGSGNSWQEGVAKRLWGTSASVGGRTYAWGNPINLRDSLDQVAELRLGDLAPQGNLGLGNTFRFGNFAVYGLISGQYGGSIYNQVKQTTIGSLRHAIVDQYGKPEERKKPSTYYTAIYDGNSVHNYYMETGTWAKLTEVNVAYTVPTSRMSWFRHTGLSQLRVEVTGRDLFTWTNYSGIDPEVSSVTSNNLIRYDPIQQPRYRKFTTVLNLTF